MAKSKYSLVELSPEVGLLILLQITSTKDLHSFIRAFSRHYNIFRLNKLRILISVINQAFHPRLIPLALKVCDAAHLSRPSKPFLTEEDLDELSEMPDPGDSYVQEKRASVFKFLTAFERHAQPQRIPKETSTVYSLCRLQRLLEHFIDDFKAVTLKKLKETKSKVGIRPSSHERLSFMEYSRLQRAFLHFELYRRIYGGFESHVWAKRGLGRVYAEHSYFATNLNDCEIGELLAVQEYLVRRMESVFDNSEKWIMSRILEAAGRRDKEQGQISCIEHLELHGLGIYDCNHKGTQQSIGDHLIGLGLPFCKRFFSMSVEDQTRVILLFRFSPCTPSLSSVILDKKTGSPEPAGSQWLAEHGSSQNMPPSWLEASSPSKRPKSSTYRDQDYGFRQTGYYFWDNARATPEYWESVKLPSPCQRDRASERSVDIMLMTTTIRYDAWNDIPPKRPDSKELTQMILQLEY